ncbi:GEVED domain-containing protein [Adhaeribacter radiodurans]|uniref:T9SS type A sorting domain-containing protein n=1 Tax=Adhaeribacter radiodurans TaxID=2745197 RepID=A0A7L7L2N9_9BACT|nr:GEVED domain-containing protein [Adhaeribacter radiodurans]QMU26719.1 T9SS type A sorting domain-containing protein [Adhaeribacter radiodurans]
MKKFNLTLLLIILLWRLGGSAYAQKPIYLGKIKDVAATYKHKSTVAAKSSSGPETHISYSRSGKPPLKLKLNASKQDGTAEFFYGEVFNTKSSSFYLKITNSEVSGSIILLKQKEFYRYSTMPDGSVYLTEEDIDKVLCVGLPKATEEQKTKKQKEQERIQGRTRLAATAAAIPALESLPGVGAVVYLDFDGQTITNTMWNSAYTQGKPIVAEPSTYTATEIAGIWKQVSEDFRPFALNITTSEAVFNKAPVNRRMRVIFTPTDYFYTDVAGTAIHGSFDAGGTSFGEQPCWVFTYGTNYILAGRTGSHEAGHTLGLSHDGRISPYEEYFQGQGAWAPIMGGGRHLGVTQWSKGEYPSANNQEDDLNKIATLNGFSYRADDHGNSINTATPLVKDANGNVSGLVNKGIISTPTDVDVFTFTHNGGPIALTVNTELSFSNLDIYLTLRNPTGTVVATANPATLAATLETTLPAGTYYLTIDGTTGILGANSDYGSLGGYSISTKDYGVPLYAMGCYKGEEINNFSFNTLFNNNSGCGGGTTTGYTNYAPTGTFTTSVNRGQSYTMKLQAGAIYHQFFGVWIDYNQDKDFDDAGEFVYASPKAEISVITANITIPAIAALGNTRMRVRSISDVPITSTESCTLIHEGVGEAEDYTITIVEPVSAYCTPVYTIGCRNDDYINNFSFNNLVNNNTVCGSVTANGYTVYAPRDTRTTSVNRGQSYTIQMQSGAFAEYFGVWIDYNQDKDFDDPGEFVYASPSTGTGVFTGNITIPATATLGATRLRVRSSYEEPMTSTKSCKDILSGEAEDYTITITQSVNQWNARFGGSGTDAFSTVIKTSDGGYLSGGYTTSGISGDKSQNSQGKNDYWIVKSDAAGKKLWEKRYGGSSDDYLNTIIQTSDGGYLLGGSSLSGVSGDKTQASRGDRDYWVVKVSGTGIKQWDKRFGGSGYDELKKMLQITNGNYLLAGTSSSPAGGDKSQGSQGGQDYWIIQINASGTKVWDKRYGGSSNENLEGLAPTLTGGFLLGGSSASGISGDKTKSSWGGNDFWLVRITGTGQKVWDKRFGGSETDDLMDLGSTGTSTGNFYIAGHSTSGVSGDKTQPTQGGKDFWMLKINGNGDKIFDKRFGGSQDEGLRSIILTQDGGYLLAGRSQSGVSGDRTQASQGSNDYWIVKTSSTGMVQWNKRFGGSGEDELRAAFQTSDGGYVLGGKSNSGVSGDRTQPSQGDMDYWLVKVAPVTTPVPVVTQPAAPVEETKQLTSKVDLIAYPNPFSHKSTVRFSIPETQTITVKVIDNQGREVAVLFQGEAKANQEYEVDWKVQNQPAGIYLLELQTPAKRYPFRLMRSN